MEGEGFEPSKAEPSDLQSDPFDRSGTPPNETSNCEGIALISQCAFFGVSGACTDMPETRDGGGSGWTRTNDQGIMRHDH